MPTKEAIIPNLAKLPTEDSAVMIPPAVNRFGDTIREWEHVLPKSPIGRAIHYTYNIYHKLTRYHLDGRYRIDNNLAENSIRPIACGRKNYLFCSLP